MDQADATAQAEALVRAYCGWHIAPELTEDLTLDGPGTGALLLPSLYVVEVGSITEDGTLLDAASYQWSEAGMVRKLGYSSWVTGAGSGWSVSCQPRWTSSLRGLVVQLKHGYEEMPPEVQAVIDRVTARAMEGSSVLSQVGAVSYALGEDGMPATGHLTSSDQAVLDLYRLPYRL